MISRNVVKREKSATWEDEHELSGGDLHDEYGVEPG